ncbi:mitogen-activated protein kinase kinase kinase YODA-like [Quillaja saponaria]|uniref:mitogen-activated protein kinase kinase kinase n=1 Tax=Quillaja saponaria TaxID=32244 RepID=A0AAD7LYQ4_QUISA|nr:mitogen-activated protein kinase kinase kinase YODA-like [Quillaja saponaria]KAJ7966662.1 mitogen-activated protein kinase kinase kinase YODA-like [Quillaja saponaria]
MPLSRKPISSSALPYLSLSSFVYVPDHVHSDDNFVNGRKGHSFPQRRLTRQRKPQYFSNHDLGLYTSVTSTLLPASPESTPKSWSLPGSDHCSSSSVPLPLPSPGFSLTRIPEASGSPNIGLAQLGSSRLELPSNALGRRYSQDLTVDDAKYNLRVKVPPASFSTNDFSSPVAPQTLNRGDLFTSYLANDSANSSNNNGKGFFQDVDIEVINYNLRLHSAARSAPTSIFSCPTTSPRRSSNVDFFPLFSEVRHELQNNHAGYSSTKVSTIRTMNSADHSPLHSPTIRGTYLNPKSQERVAKHQHRKFLNMERPENNSHVAAHPLPLPPRANLPVQLSIQAQSSVVHHATENPYVSPMKSQWQKGKLIGRGTFGSVYMAINRETGASCAMKEVDLIPNDPKSAECIKQLEQEIKVLRQLEHPNIVKYFGSEIVDNHFYIYLEYVHPGSINKFVRESCGAITESVVQNFTRHILSGLAYLHSTKTIHRDIKGANLLVDASGTVKLADFGMAKFLTGQSDDLSLKGSPYWMAPEIMMSAIKKDANPNPNLALAVDIWSLGCTIIEMLTGKPPWSEFEGPQAMFKVLHRSPPIPETLSSDGKDFLQQCFQRDPADRPSAEKLLEHRFVQNWHNRNVSVHSNIFQTEPIR